MADETFGLYKFDDNVKIAFDWFKDKMFATGGLKNFDNALTSNLSNADPQTSTPITANVMKNKYARNLLMLAPKRPPRYMIDVSQPSVFIYLWINWLLNMNLPPPMHTLSSIDRLTKAHLKILWAFPIHG